MKLTAIKRLLIFALAGAIMLPSCSQSTGNSSKAPEDSSHEQTTSTAPEESSLPDEPEHSYKRTLISRGKSYTTSTDANEKYPDMFGQQLTDGQKVGDYGTTYYDIRMLGYTEDTRFIFDLGEDGKRISSVSVRSADVNRDGVKLPSRALVYGSNDGKGWTSLGSSKFESKGDGTIGTALFELDEPTDYSYIRVGIVKSSGSAFFFTDEIEIFADIDEPAPDLTQLSAYQSEGINRDEWKSLSTGKTAHPVEWQNIAAGTAYTFEDAVLDERSKVGFDTAKLIGENKVKGDFGKLLTDGESTGRHFGDRVWYGISASSPSSLTVDLGKTYDNLYSVKLHMLSCAAEVEFPDYIDVYGGVNKDEFVLLGRIYSPTSGENHAFTLLLPEYISARYIRLCFPAGRSNYWMEELEVFSGFDSPREEELYPPVTYPKVTENLFWSDSEPDYDDYQNLLLGKKQQVGVSFYMSPSTPAGSQPQTPWDSPILTDGKLATDAYCYNGQWFYHAGGGAIDFFFDLERLSEVRSVSLSYQVRLDWGINHPNYVTVFLSEDATRWYPVEYYKNDKQPTQSFSRQKCEFVFDTPYRARFIRIRCESAALFIDEIEAWGSKHISDSAVPLGECGVDYVNYFTNDDDYRYATTENTPIKATNIPIVYGSHSTREELLALAAYLDKDGNIVDTFMDGFLYCPTGMQPTGFKGDKSDWDYLLDTIVNGDTGINLLEATVGEVKDALGLQDYKVQVYITILAFANNTAFGDVDGDGISEDVTTPEGRRRVLEWYMSTVKESFRDRGYQNIELGGFYWISESINYYNDDSEIVKEVADVVHAADSYLLWIPYYNAHRAYLGYELGFDFISQQPNYVFSLDAGAERFDALARRVKALGFSVEIENTSQSMGEPVFARRYMKYLYHGAVNGYMDNSVHIYYDDINNFSKMAYSDSQLCRMQYDATYHFAKGTLKVTPEKKDDVYVTTSANTPALGALADSNGYELFTLLTPPQHGYVTLTEDGSFAYFPDKDFTGTDSFTYTFNQLLGESLPCTVNIDVTK